MSELKIIGWTNFDSDYPTKLYEREEFGDIIHLIQVEIDENNYSFTGDYHQRGATGVPVFSDGTCFRASMRCWGSIMAAVHSFKTGKKLTYMDFYMDMSFGEEPDMVVPKSAELSVAPAEIEQEYFGYTTQEDTNLLNETLSFGMPLMTTDKVLDAIYQMVSSQLENDSESSESEGFEESGEEEFNEDLTADEDETSSGDSEEN